MPSEAQVEINTELARKLQEILDNAKKRDFNPSPALKKHLRQKQEGAPAAKEHQDSKKPAQAVLGKNSVYREKGTRYLRAQDGRGVYRNFSHGHLEKIRDLARSVAEFPNSKLPQNFDRKARGSGKDSGAKWPYAWEAHHIIPGDAFTHVKKAVGQEKPLFTQAQYDVLLLTEYDLNHGHNIIMLPDENWAVPIHVLLQHPSDHPDYTDLVIKRLGELAKEFQKIVDKKQAHQGLEGAMFDLLKDLEEELWQFLVNLSKRVVEAVLEGQKFEDGPVRFSTKDGKTSYKWGALY
jgi:hypothetical protein